MRWDFPGVLTPPEAASLAADVGYLGFDDPRLAGIVSKVRDVAPVMLSAPSYVRVEQNKAGHPWHCDRGARDHMRWCRYSGGCLLVPPDRFTGGGFYFRDRGPVFHYLDFLFWDSDQDNEHRVAGNSGERICLIMFFGATDG